MRVSLEHKRHDAGSGPARAAWIEALQKAGHEVCPDGDVVIAVGGDGTITRAAHRIAGEPRPLLVVPQGTANNLAHGLGLEPPAAPLAYALDVLAAPRPRRLDVGLAEGAFGVRTFYEGAGVGLFADALAEVLSEEDKHPLLAARRLADFLDRHAPPELAVTLDGEDASGRYTLVEVMNVGMLGPNLQLGGDADPSDGLFDVVLIGADAVADLRGYLEHKAAGGQDRPPRFRCHRAHDVRVSVGGNPLRLDGEVVRRTGRKGANARFSMRRGALEVWLPA